MKLKIALILFVFFVKNIYSQDVDAAVSIIHPKVQISNPQIFTSLKSSIEQFINQRKWSEDQIQPIERFKIQILIEITAYNVNTNDFGGTIQLVASRPVFGSTYNSIIFNHLDEDFIFNYQEFQNMEFQQNANIYNLTGILAFYTYTIVGLNYETQSLGAGNSYFLSAREILNASQSITGWKPNDGKGMRNRFYIIDNITCERYKPLIKTIFDYHFNGLDKMHEDVAKGRDEVFKSIESMQDLVKNFPNSVMIRIFFQSKYKELIEIFKEAPVAEKTKAIELLSRLDPANRQFYEKIK